MLVSLQEFEAAALEIEELLASTLVTITPATAGSPAATQWVADATTLLQKTGRLLASARPELSILRARPEIQHLRTALKSLRDIVESTQERLLLKRDILDNELEHQTRAHAWAKAISKIV